MINLPYYFVKNCLWYFYSSNISSSHLSILEAFKVPPFQCKNFQVPPPSNHPSPPLVIYECSLMWHFDVNVLGVTPKGGPKLQQKLARPKSNNRRWTTSVNCTSYPKLHWWVWGMCGMCAWVFVIENLHFLTLSWFKTAIGQVRFCFFNLLCFCFPILQCSVFVLLSYQSFTISIVTCN